MRLTTKFSAFVTLLTGLTIFVTLLGCSLSFYNAIQYKFSHRVQAVATAIDTHLVSNDFSTLRPQITELMMSADIVRVDLLHGDKQVYTLARNGSYRPVGSSDLFRELSVPLIKHPGMSLRLVYQDPMGNYFHSLMTTAPLTGAIGFIIVMLFLAVRWLQRQLAGQELLETRATRILNGERGSNVLGTIYEWPPRTSSALDTLLREIQNAREQHSRLDTLIRSYAAQDVKTGLNNRLFFDNQLATLLEDQEKVGTHGIVMMIRLPDFNMLSDTWGHSQVEEQFFTLTNLLSTFMMRYPGALLARYHRSDFAALLPHRTLKEAESIAGQLIKAVDTLPNNKMLDRDDMIHIGICAWRSGQDTEQVMEHAESATRNAGLQGGNSWAIYDDSLPEKGRGNVRWRTLIEQMLSRGGPRLYQKPAVTREGQVHHRRDARAGAIRGRARGEESQHQRSARAPAQSRQDPGVQPLEAPDDGLRRTRGAPRRDAGGLQHRAGDHPRLRRRRYDQRQLGAGPLPARSPPDRGARLLEGPDRLQRRRDEHPGVRDRPAGEPRLRH